MHRNGEVRIDVFPEKSGTHRVTLWIFGFKNCICFEGCLDFLIIILTWVILDAQGGRSYWGRRGLFQ